MSAIRDNVLAAKVSDALANDPKLKSASIVWVDVASGVVELHGTVDFPFQAIHAKKVAMSVPGVKRVLADLTIEPEAKADDEKIRIEAEAAVGGTPGVSLKDVGVHVKDGVVTLVGTVRSRAEETAVTLAVSSVPGVKDVVSDLAIGEVPPEEAAAVVDDAVLKGMVSAAVADRGVEILDDETTVVSSVAYLRGRVNTEKEKALAEQAAAQVEGIRDVSNELEVGLP